MKRRYITHSGIVTSISDDRIFITIRSESACSSCHAKGACSMSEQVDKIVDVDLSDYPNVACGDIVEVVISKRSGILAVFLAYILPVVLLVISLYLFNIYDLSELAAGLTAIGLVTLYFFVLFLLRKKVVSKIKIYIKI